MTLYEQFPPSSSCGCDTCRNYCRRPGWWTVEQARNAIRAGLAERMMIEVAPEMTFAVISPAFIGCEGFIATNEGAQNGCNFLVGGLCELHGTDFMPLECSFCHHDRVDEGVHCHAALEAEWNTHRGQVVVKRWQKAVNFEEKLRTIKEI